MPWSSARRSPLSETNGLLRRPSGSRGATGSEEVVALISQARFEHEFQVDVKVVARGRSKWFQYTAIDDCTRMRLIHRGSAAKRDTKP